MVKQSEAIQGTEKEFLNEFHKLCYSRSSCGLHYCKSNLGRRIILVRGYKPVSRCKDCGKIYDKGIPYICSKCGAEIGKPTPTILQMMGCGEVTLTEKCEKVVAKKGLFGWKVREPQNPEVMQE